MIQTRTRRHVCFVTIIEGNIATPLRERCEARIFERLTANRVDVSLLAINDNRCSLAVDEFDLRGVRAALQSLNVALRVRKRCARISVKPHDGEPLPALWAVIKAMSDANIGIVHLAESAGSLTLLVDEREAERAHSALVQCTMTTPRAA